MGQERYWNWKDDDLTFRLNQWLLGVLNYGLYKGFDAEFNAGTTLTLSHTLTGHYKTLKNKGLTPALGVYITKQGVVITEDAPVDLQIGMNLTANARIDYIVVSHEYLDLEGGITSVYKVIQGDDNGNEPSLDEDNIEIILGKLTVGAGTTSLSQPSVSYVKTESPDLAGIGDRYVRKYGGVLGGDLNAGNHKITNLAIPSTNFDATNKKYVDDTIATILSDGNYVQDDSYVHTDNNFTSALLVKLNGIATNAEVNVQPDWSESDSEEDTFINNKPDFLLISDFEVTYGSVVTDGNRELFVYPPAGFDMTNLKGFIPSIAEVTIVSNTGTIECTYTVDVPSGYIKVYLVFVGVGADDTQVNYMAIWQK